MGILPPVAQLEKHMTVYGDIETIWYIFYNHLITSTASACTGQSFQSIILDFKTQIHHQEVDFL